MIDYYKILKLNKNDNLDKLKKNYKKLIIINHPDRGGCIEKFKEITEAYSILSNIDKKIEYDIKLNNNDFNKIDIFDSYYTRNTNYNLNLIINNEYLKHRPNPTIF